MPNCAIAGTDRRCSGESCKGIAQNVELVPGDICETLPDYVEQHPELRLSLINLDTDLYEATVTGLEVLYPRLSTGGVVLLDDYGVFPGETRAVDEYFGGSVRVRALPVSRTPAFIVKE
jgi:hypothetical protein